MIPKVSVIVPVYNSSLYLERCTRSLFNQTLKEIEFVFVDDCSKDNSVEILKSMVKEYSIQKGKVKIIQHKTNKGSAGARNTGLEYATGEYIGWVDSDDYVDVTIFEELYLFAENHDADMVWCDYFNVRLDGQLCEVKQALKEDPDFFAKALLLNDTQGNIWNKLMRRSLFKKNNLWFLEGQDMAEDFCLLFKFLHFSKKITYLNKSLYFYCHSNADSISKQINTERIYQGLANAQEVIDFISERKLGLFSDRELNEFKYFSKKRFLSSHHLDDFKAWKNIFPESNYLSKENLLAKTPNLLGRIVVMDNWFIIKVWVTLKQIKILFTSYINHLK